VRSRMRHAAKAMSRARAEPRNSGLVGHCSVGRAASRRRIIERRSALARALLHSVGSLVRGPVLFLRSVSAVRCLYAGARRDPSAQGELLAALVEQSLALERERPAPRPGGRPIPAHRQARRRTARRLAKTWRATDPGAPARAAPDGASPCQKFAKSRGASCLLLSAPDRYEDRAN
jgi:hypothetical protein